MPDPIVTFLEHTGHRDLYAYLAIDRSADDDQIEVALEVKHAQLELRRKESKARWELRWLADNELLILDALSSEEVSLDLDLHELTVDEERHSFQSFICGDLAELDPGPEVVELIAQKVVRLGFSEETAHQLICDQLVGERALKPITIDWSLPSATQVTPHPEDPLEELVETLRGLVLQGLLTTTIAERIKRVAVEHGVMDTLADELVNMALGVELRTQGAITSALRDLGVSPGSPRSEVKTSWRRLRALASAEEDPVQRARIRVRVDATWASVRHRRDRHARAS